MPGREINEETIKRGKGVFERERERDFSTGGVPVLKGRSGENREEGGIKRREERVSRRYREDIRRRGELRRTKARAGGESKTRRIDDGERKSRWRRGGCEKERERETERWTSFSH